jgi:hypothetical protein
MKAHKTYEGEKTASSTHIAGKTGYVHVENSNLTHVFHSVQISIQLVSNTLM